MESAGDASYVLHAFYRGLSAGYLRALRDENGHMILCDIMVYESVPRFSLWFFGQIRLGGRLGKLTNRSIRRQGIGTMFLKRFLGHCSETGIREVYGTVMHDGLAQNPGLLRWYEKHGFLPKFNDPRLFRDGYCVILWHPGTIPRAEFH